MYTNLPTSQGCIFRISQLFATKLCSFSNFPKMSFVIPRLIKDFSKAKSFIYKQNILEEAPETLIGRSARNPSIFKRIFP